MKLIKKKKLKKRQTFKFILTFTDKTVLCGAFECFRLNCSATICSYQGRKRIKTAYM